MILNAEHMANRAQALTKELERQGLSISRTRQATGLVPAGTIVCWRMADENMVLLCGIGDRSLGRVLGDYLLDDRQFAGTVVRQLLATFEAQ
jgi:hypothetical protein